MMTVLKTVVVVVMMMMMIMILTARIPLSAFDRLSN